MVYFAIKAYTETMLIKQSWICILNCGLNQKQKSQMEQNSLM